MKKKMANKKEMSEGKAIALAVLLITGGIVGFIYAIRFILDFLFPGW